MGWTFHTEPQTRQSFISKITDSSFYNTELDVIKTSVVGNTVFAVLEYNTGERQGKRFLAPTIISYDRSDECYGYKDLCEADICYHDMCPKHIIDLVEENPYHTDEKAVNARQEGRERIEQYNAQRKRVKQLRAGAKVKLFDVEYELELPLGPRLGWQVSRASDGKKFRMLQKQLNQADILTA